MKRELTCINCPMGCRIIAEVDGQRITSLSGYSCLRGKAYAEAEITDPTRMLTTLVAVAGTHVPLPVKTERPISKKLMGESLAVLRLTKVQPPVAMGDVVVENICGSGVNVVATATIE